MIMKIAFQTPTKTVVFSKAVWQRVKHIFICFPYHSNTLYCAHFIHLRAILDESLTDSIRNMCSEKTFIKLQPYLSVAPFTNMVEL